MKIYLTVQPKPTTTTTSSTSGSFIDIDRLAAAIEQQYKNAHNLKGETLNPYDSATGDGTPSKCIYHHDKYNQINYIMTKSEMPKFKNDLTLDKHSVPQEPNFVTIGRNGNQYCINRDGSLFRYL